MKSFSEWGRIPAPEFTIVDAVAAAAAVQERHEDLSSPDNDDLQPPNQSLPKATATLATPATATLATTASHNKQGSRRERHQKRAAANAVRDALADPRSPPRRHQVLPGLKKPIITKFHIMKARIAATGWVGVQGKKEPDLHRLEDFFGPGAKRKDFTLVKVPPPGESRPVVDSEGKIFAVHGSTPKDPTFISKVHDPAVAALEKARDQMSIPAGSEQHRRGKFVTLTGGQSHGNRREGPMDVTNGVINAAVFLALITNAAFISLAGFATSLFATWAPNVFDFYVDYMSCFYAHYPNMQRPFLNSIWSACTFNLGPHTWSLGHRDFNNVPFGWCAITALGHFDFTKGGHLILWDCKLILEFPPGSTILVPSAAIYHSNISVESPETRYSFTQYTAGGLFRYVERGFKSETAYFASLTPAEVEEERELGLKRAMEGAGMFSTIAELKAAIRN
ncbi:hypothetical protein R3P38DRAFT_2773188 [Favolaschia claudopus]|uniref:Uncharacterized protein n=1 Tax=Favolaschia claudopus TaxID=2862362 RepID=A0AAW0C5G7_9AGAR